MKRLLLGFCLATSLCFAGCTKSVESEIKDVHEAKKAKEENVKEELREASDAARQGDDKIIKEAREAEDAKNREANRVADPLAPAPITPAPTP